MSRYRKVDVRMWNDAKFRELGQAAQLLWTRLLTGPETTNVPGVVPVGRAAMAEAMGWSLEAFDEAFGEVFAKGMAKADWRARLVLLPNAGRYNTPESPNVVRSWRATLDSIPECPLKDESIRRLDSFIKALPKGFREAFAEVLAKTKPKSMPNQEQEQDQEQDQEQEQEKITERERARASVSENSGEAERPGPPNPEAFNEKTRINPDWNFDDELRAVAVRFGVRDSVTAVTMFTTFKSYHRSKGTIAASWPAAWELWCAREGSMGQNGHGRTGRPSTVVAGAFETSESIRRRDSGPGMSIEEQAKVARALVEGLK